MASESCGNVKDSFSCYEVIKEIYKKEELDIDLFESCFAVYLDRSYRAIGFLKIAEGGIDGVVCDIRKVFTGALESMATAFVFTHNHPSGSLRPSQEDKDLTKRLKEAGKIMGIQLMDHLIVTKDAYFSFAESRMLN